MTTLNEAREAILQRFESSFTKTDLNGSAIFYRYGEEEGEPGFSENLVLVNVVNRVSRQDTLGKDGNRKFERRGIIMCKIGTVIEHGLAVTDDLINRFLTLFEACSFSGVITHNSIIRNLQSDGHRVYRIIEIDFETFETK